MIPAARTGKLKTSKNTVIKNAQRKTSLAYMSVPKTRIVVKKLIPPIMEEAPAKCNAKITQSTQAPG